MRRREIDGPEQDWLTAEQAAAFLGLDLVAFRSLDRRGIIRGARKWTHKKRMWPWKAVVILSWEMEMGLIPEKILRADDRNQGRPDP